MRNNCSMKLCTNSRTKNIGMTFFTFPRDVDRCKLWVEACHREDLKDINAIVLNKNYHVCSSHFTNSMFISDAKNRLRTNAVPVSSLIISNKSKMTDFEYVLIINSPEINNPDETIKEETNDLPDSCFDRMETNEEPIIIGDELCGNDNTFSILRNVLQEKQDAIPNLVISKEHDGITTLVLPENCEVGNMCRVCCLPNDDMKEIETDYFNNLLIQEMLQYCINFTLPEEKKLPKKICAQCLVEVNIVYEFIQKCENSKIFLEHHINKLEEKTKQKIVDDGHFFDDSYQEFSDLDDFEDEEPFTDSKTERNRCGKCKQSFEVENGFLNHVCDVKTNKNTKKRVYTCKMCQEKFNKLYLLTAHRKSMHKDCETPKQMKDKTLIRCVRCDITFTTAEELASHKQEQHSQNRIIVCPVCSKKMTALAYKGHKEIHATKPKYCCEYCGKSFNSNANFRHHIFVHSDEKPFVCDVCGKTFRVRARLIEHSAIHKSERQYTCETCGKSYRHKSVLRAHFLLKRCGKAPGRKGNKGPVNFLCEVCDQQFRMKIELISHESSHGTKTHTCTGCSKTFFTIKRLKQHMKIHLRERKIPCPSCDKRFVSNATMRKHLVVHTGEKSYACSFCPKTFSQSTHLRAHERTHTGQKPYKCPHCDRAFALSGNLNAHIRIHTGERPYECRFCPQAFYDASAAKKHMHTKHSSELIDADD